MLKKNICIAIVTAVAYLIQITFIHYIEIYTVVPNLMIIVLVCAALSEQDVIRTALYGVMYGMLLDFSAETIFGINSLLCMYTALLCNIAGQKLFKGKFLVNILLVFVMSFIYEAAYYALSFSMRESSNALMDLLYVAIPTAAYNGVLSMGIIFGMKKIASIE